MRVYAHEKGDSILSLWISKPVLYVLILSLQLRTCFDASTKNLGLSSTLYFTTL